MEVGEHGRYTGQLGPGAYILKMTRSGYADFQDNLVVGGTVATIRQDITLSPVLARGQVRIVLTWGAKPRDVDSYLKVPATAAATACTVSYLRKICTGATLDKDDTDGFGPETITISALSAGTYTYLVKNYSGEVGASLRGARVVVYTGDGNPPQVFIAGANGQLTGARNTEVWNVFTINGATGAIRVV